tara:strand:- start:6060 stop:6791 length:732 start_codon:yes stop_codon:yes gene_type:complete
MKNSLKEFNENGFAVLKVFNKKTIEKYKKKVLNNLKKSAEKKSIKSLRKLKRLENYFSFISDEDHVKLMDRETRTIKIDNADTKTIMKEKFGKIFSYFSDKEYKIFRSNGVYSWAGSDITNYAGFRIVKPKSQKVAGYHSDHYNLKNFRFTAWVPLVGFSNKYSLNLLPGSHLIKHPNSATTVNNIGTATLIKNEYVNKFKKPFRPNLKPGEVILFHPYLIHGNSVNLGKTLRVSFEIRICTI